jgi:cytoskeletal protein CcmA (bactofilin family)
MFKKEERMDAVPSDSSVGTLIGKGTHVNGTIKVNGSLRIDGEVEGHVMVSSGLVVGPSGTITAEIHVQDAAVSGKIQGKIIAKGRVELKKGSRLEGDVHAAVFKIEDGAIFQGNCTMGEVPAKSAPKPQPVAVRQGTQAAQG